MSYKKFVNFTIFSFVLAGFILTFGNGEWFPDFYRPKFMGVLSFFCAALVTSIPKIFKSNEPEKQESVIKLQAAIAVVILLNGLGALGLFKLHRIGFPYDKLLHFSNSFILLLSLNQFICQWKKIDFKKSLIRAGILVLISGFVWELLEFSSDEIFKTTAFGIDGNHLFEDTIKDIAFNIGGIITGVFVLLPKNKK
jgi:hypothetical protein